MDHDRLQDPVTAIIFLLGLLRYSSAIAQNVFQLSIESRRYRAPNFLGQRTGSRVKAKEIGVGY